MKEHEHRELGLSDRLRRLRDPRRGDVAAGPAGTLDFRVPAQEAGRIRQALSILPRCCITRCVPHPTDREVALRITFGAGERDALMGLLMACVPCGQFGRVRSDPDQAAHLAH